MCNMTAFQDQDKSDKQQDKEAENFKIWVFAYIIGNCAGEKKHDSNGDDNGANHDQEDVRHSDHRQN